MKAIAIKVRQYGDAYLAQVMGEPVKASCTSSAEFAARAAGQKVFGERAFSVRQAPSPDDHYTVSKWIAEAP